MASRRLLSAAARPLLVASLVSAPMLVMASPAGADTGGSSTAAATATTTPLVPVLSTTTTTTTTAPAAHSTTTSTSTTSSTTSTTVSKGPGVPPVPVGGPPTTVAPAGSPSTTAPPQPSVDPIVAQVDVDLDQLSAIDTYKPAQALVAKAQSRVTEAGAALLSDRQSMQRADGAEAKANQTKSTADSKLRTLALAAYMGLGYSIPGAGSGAPGNSATGLTGMDAVDAQEMLVVVGQHARQADNGAAQALVQATHSVKVATSLYKHDQDVVNASEAQLLAAQQTLKLVTTAAITPGAAAATPLADLMSYIQSGGQKQPPATTTTAPSTTVAASSTSSTVTGTLTPALQEATAVIPNPVAPNIIGQPQLNADQLLAWWNTLNRKPNITVPMKDLIASYAKWGTRLGVRYDVAFAQSIVETGSFSFPSFGQLTDKDNNFAGIGACDTCAKGWSFPSADTGVLAQLELLREYATNDPLPKGIPNVIGGTGVGGCCQSWTQLAGKWASSTVYGISIMTVYQQELAWLIPQNEVSAGLIAPTSPAAKGPDLAPLPGSTPPANPLANPAANKAAATDGKASGPTTTSTTAPPSVTAAGTKH